MQEVIKKVQCRCGHEWYPKKPGRPVTCPKCGSPHWDKARVRPIRK